ncbi:MAG: hypothetical protein M0P59_15275 [Gallionella sp.]|jgi:hypothetical protein|nr:hypothetical protein [Gallionella sp.]
MAEEIKMTPKQLEDAMYERVMERVQNEERLRDLNRNESSFRYGGKLTEFKISNPSQKFRDSIDEKGVKTRVPVLDANEQPSFWEAQYFCTLVQHGGSDKFTVSLELGKDLNEGLWYRFEGSRGGEGKKDKVKLITQI